MRLNKVRMEESPTQVKNVKAGTEIYIFAAEEINQPENFDKTGKSYTDCDTVCRSVAERHKDENGGYHHQVQNNRCGRRCGKFSQRVQYSRLKRDDGYKQQKRKGYAGERGCQLDFAGVIGKSRGQERG